MAKSGMFETNASGSGEPGRLAPGATGFHYITPGNDWDDTTLSRRRSFFRLVTLPVHIWRELLKGVLLAIVVFSVLLMAVFAGQVMKDGVGVYTLVMVLPNLVPMICPFVLPLAIITGIIMCYSRLTKDNEILAAYAGGINPFWLMLPALLTSTIAIFVTLTLNESALYPALKNIERLIIDDQANILTRMVTRPGNITVPAGDEYLAMSKLDAERDPLGRSSLDITRFVAAGVGDSAKWDPRYPFPAKRVVARDHRIQDLSDEGRDELVLKMSIIKPIFQDLHATDINKSFVADGESGEERITLQRNPSVTLHGNRTSFWPILMLSDSKRSAENEIERIDAAMKRMPVEQTNAYRVGLERLQRTVRSRNSEINMRLALSFSCFAFAVLGIPLGMRSRGTIASSFVIGIITACVYFMMLKSAQAQANKGILPVWTIWIPDVLVIIVGIFLWRRTSAAK